MATPLRCPKCDADLDGGPIPEDIKASYSPPYRWSRAISVYSRETDGHDHWQCPDCQHPWQTVPEMPEILTRIRDAISDKTEH